jgi:5-methylcytosine-specific restriction endonuclease McrA
MGKLQETVAAHPLTDPLYTKLHFRRVDGQGTPLYRVEESDKDVGAAEALRIAFERYGGTCFHCGEALKPQPLSQGCTRDHVRPRRDGGRDWLHNLVLACGTCNRKKGAKDIVAFNPESGKEYLKALEEHLCRCIAALAD